jgi:hypothetical protein
MLVIKGFVQNSRSKKWEVQLIGVDCGTYGSGEYCWVYMSNSSVQKFKSVQEAEDFWNEYKNKGLLRMEEVKEVEVADMQTVFFEKKKLS